MFLGQSIFRNLTTSPFSHKKQGHYDQYYRQSPSPQGSDALWRSPLTTPDDASDHFTTSSYPLSSIPTRTNPNSGPHSLSPSATNGKNTFKSKSKNSPQRSAIMDNRQLSPPFLSQSQNHDDKISAITTAVTIARTIHSNHSPIGKIFNLYISLHRMCKNVYSIIFLTFLFSFTTFLSSTKSVKGKGAGTSTATAAVFKWK